MEYLIGLLIAALGGILYFKNKAFNARIESKFGRTQGREDILAKQQEAYRRQREEIEAGIAKAKDELAKRRVEKLTDQERADKWNQ